MNNRGKILSLVIAILVSPVIRAGELQGVLGWSDIAKLGFVVTGSVDAVNVQSGARVTRGQMLVQLEQRPFILHMKKYKASIETIEPLLFDSQIELSQAEELYDRTVLSQVELQKIEARHRGLQAQSRVAQMDYELAKWRLEKSGIKAPFDGLVINNQFISGQVIGEENKVEVALLIAPAGVMSVTVFSGVGELSILSVNQPVKVSIGSDQYDGVVREVKMQPGDNGQYRSVIEFKYPQGKDYYAGQAAKVIY